MAGFLIVSPLQAGAYVAIYHNAGFALALTFGPLAALGFGLVGRPVLETLTNRKPSFFDLSAKGAILATTGTFVCLLILLPLGASRFAGVAPFLAGLLGYYAFGKFGCIAFGCCRAVGADAADFRLPLFEALAALALAVVVLASMHEAWHTAWFTIAAVTLAFFGVRISSRLARGQPPTTAFLELDSIILAAASVTVVAVLVLY